MHGGGGGTVRGAHSSRRDITYLAEWGREQPNVIAGCDAQRWWPMNGRGLEWLTACGSGGRAHTYQVSVRRSGPQSAIAFNVSKCECCWHYSDCSHVSNTQRSKLSYAGCYWKGLAWSCRPSLNLEQTSCRFFCFAKRKRKLCIQDRHLNNCAVAKASGVFVYKSSLCLNPKLGRHLSA